jgi:hypothetical protein
MNLKVKTEFYVIFRIVNTVLVNARRKQGELNRRWVNHDHLHSTDPITVVPREQS